MKIVQLTAENIKKLKVIDITPTKGFIQITGKNGSGKTSVLDAIWYALAGGSVIPDEPIRKGEEKATIRLDLGNIIVTRRFSKSGTTLVVENTDGARYQKPQDMLDALIGQLTFDPLEFSRMRPDEQFKTLRKVADVKIDYEDIAKLNKADTEKRRDIGRDITALEGQVAGIVVRDDAPDQGVSVQALMQEMTIIENENGVLREAEIEQENARLLHQAKDKLRAELAEELLNLEAELGKLKDFLKNAPPIVYKSTDELKAKIASAEAVNAAYHAKVRKGELNGQIALKQKDYDAFTKKLEDRAAFIDRQLTESKMPIDGLTLGESMVVFNGVPFAQLSSAEQLRVSVAIAMAANPKLKIIRIQDGSLLDDDSLAILQEMTAAHDYQVWCERVDSTGKIGIVMEDGAIKTTNEGAA